MAQSSEDSRVARAKAPPGERRVPGRLIVGFFILIAGGFLIYIAYEAIRRPTASPISPANVLTPEQAGVFGREAGSRLLSRFGGRHGLPAAQAQVDHATVQLVAGSPDLVPDRTFECDLLGDSTVINAFGTPSGGVYLTAGLLREIGNWKQAAALVAHEMGHIIGGHAATSIAQHTIDSNQTGAAVISAYDPVNPAGARAAAMSNLVDAFIAMRFTPEQEREADEIAVRLLNGADYPPDALLAMMTKLHQISQQRQVAYTAKHPLDEARLAYIAEMAGTPAPEAEAANQPDE